MSSPGGEVSSTKLFASRVFEDLGEKSQSGDGTLPKSPIDKINGTIPTRKKKISVRRKKFHTLEIGDSVSMDEVPSFTERALVGHARWRNLNQSSLNKWVVDS